MPVDGLPLLAAQHDAEESERFCATDYLDLLVIKSIIGDDALDLQY
jgi:hypothetical protein